MLPSTLKSFAPCHRFNIIFGHFLFFLERPSVHDFVLHTLLSSFATKFKDRKFWYPNILTSFFIQIASKTKKESRVLKNSDPGARVSKVSKFFGSEKAFLKLRLAYSVKLVFLYVVKGVKRKITAKFRASRHLREDRKGIMSPEMRAKNFRTFEK